MGDPSATFLWAHRFYVLAALFAALALETLLVTLLGRRPAGPALVASTGFMWWVLQGLRALSYPLRFALFALVYAHTPLRLGGSPLALVGVYLGADFIYYWKHRLLHGTKLGWALHAVHHSSTRMDLLAALRLGWVQRMVDDVFFLPLAILGVPPAVLLGVVELNHLAPFWCHAEPVGRLGVLDRWLNTPSNHRVHHAAASTQRDHNFGSTLMLWDRLFGTYLAEPHTGAAPFGITGVRPTLDPFAIQFAPLFSWLRSRRGHGAGADSGSQAKERGEAEPHPHG